MNKLVLRALCMCAWLWPAACGLCLGSEEGRMCPNPNRERGERKEAQAVGGWEKKARAKESRVSEEQEHLLIVPAFVYVCTDA